MTYEKLRKMTKSDLWKIGVDENLIDEHAQQVERHNYNYFTKSTILEMLSVKYKSIEQLKRLETTQ